ncbi:MAG: glycosyltransferase [Steroidobacteraceae bacterium]
MSVYAREAAHQLERALQSILTQTSPPTQIVLVKDGPLTEELERVIENSRRNPSFEFVVIGLERNAGLGVALQIGLEACSSPIVARMDADDIADPTRCEKQLQFLALHPEVDAVGSWVFEFDRDDSDIYAQRTLPTNPDELTRFARRRNPFNHMSVMFRKHKVVAAGGYRPFSGFEDYFLWVRMLQNGSKLANIPECLMKVQAGANQLSRRGGWGYAMSELRFQREMLRLRFIGVPEFARNVLVRFATRVSPVTVRRQIYRAIRRTSMRDN